MFKQSKPFEHNMGQNSMFFLKVVTTKKTEENLWPWILPCQVVAFTVRPRVSRRNTWPKVRWFCAQVPGTNSEWQMDGGIQWLFYDKKETSGVWYYQKTYPHETRVRGHNFMPGVRTSRCVVCWRTPQTATPWREHFQETRIFPGEKHHA